MKKLIKIFASILLFATLVIPVFVACGKSGMVDYASQLKLDFTSDTKKQEVTVRLYVDGDTTHFDPVANSTVTPNANVSDFAETQGYIKARYLAVNTPESTGQIEEWGKKASNFTHSKLEKAKSIVVESDKDYWDIDSTGERYLLWIWYIPEDGTEYRNLNVEILQEGLAFGSKTSSNRYGTTAQAALSQAEANSLYVFSGEKDPDFYYGAMKLVTLKELRCHTDKYNGIKVKVEGTVVATFGNSAYIEDFDADTGIYFGMPVYYGFTSGKLLEILSVGNKVSVVGTVNAFNGTYQISGLAAYDAYDLNNPDNCNIIEKNQTPSFVETSAADIISGKVVLNFEVENEEGEEEIETLNWNYAEAVLGTSVTVSNLTITKINVTSNGGKSDGAMSIRCKAEDGTQITVRTEVLKDKDGKLITPDSYPVDSKITVKGIIEKYVPDSADEDVYYYQVKCYREDFITILD